MMMEMSFLRTRAEDLSPSWPLRHMHVCACKVRHAGKTDKTEKNVRATKCSMCTSRRLQGNRFSLSATNL